MAITRSPERTGTPPCAPFSTCFASRCSIVTAIRLGRRIYDNQRKATCFIIAVHVPIAGLALLPLVFGLPIILGPMHIALLEMVIDPVCSLAFEAETEEDGR